MPRIDHAALWAADLEAVCAFYSHWFDGDVNGLYQNPRTGLRSYILRFSPDAVGGRGTRLELMSRPDVVDQLGAERLGWAHVSFAVPDRGAVDRLAARMAEAGVPVIDGPRTTGDGYYEAAVLDPEGNRVEIVAGDYSDDVAARPGPVD